MIQTQPDDAPRRGDAGVSVLGWLGAIPLGLTSVVSDALQRFGELPLFHTILLCLLVLAFIYRDTIHTIMVERFVKQKSPAGGAKRATRRRKPDDAVDG